MKWEVKYSLRALYMIHKPKATSTTVSSCFFRDCFTQASQQILVSPKPTSQAQPDLCCDVPDLRHSGYPRLWTFPNVLWWRPGSPPPRSWKGSGWPDWSSSERWGYPWLTANRLSTPAEQEENRLAFTERRLKRLKRYLSCSTTERAAGTSKQGSGCGASLKWC